MKTKLSALLALLVLSIALAVTAPKRLAAQGGALRGHHHYKLIDLGTFGGPASYINAPFALGTSNLINNQGTAVGAAATPVPSALFPSKAICGGIDGIVPSIFHAFEYQNGQFIDLGALGALPDQECSEAVSVNANGEIAGRSGIGVVDPLINGEEMRAVVWKDGAIEDLGTLGGNQSIAIMINNRGQVVGVSVNTVPDPFSLLYLLGGFTNGTQARGFLWQKGLIRDLGTLGGPDSEAFGLNERGQVTGISYADSTPNPITGLPTADPFLWSDESGMVDLGTLGGAWGSAGPLNNKGQVIGNSSLAADPGACFGIGNTVNCHPFLWDDGRLIDLNTSTIGGNPITANALNDAGEIVGTAVFAGRPFSDAYVWRRGSAQDLGPLDDDCFSEAFAINSSDQIVGQSFSCVSNTLRTFLWENGSIADLNVLASSDALQLVEAFAINDRGEIGGIGDPPGCSADDQCGHAFVLIPCDEAHPNTKGCDYSLVAAAVEPQRPAPRYLPNVAQRPPQSRRTNRYHIPGLFPPSR